MSFSIHLKSSSGGLDVGESIPVRVNCNIGANNESQYEYERGRLYAIEKEAVHPDCFMDLSLGNFENPLYKDIINIFGCPVGVVPSYLFPNDKVINTQEAKDLLKHLADDGLSFFTLHLTATKELFNQAKLTRQIPVTSRGGSIVLRRILETGEDNIWKTILPTIIEIAKQYEITISLGATFRPAGIIEACDEVHTKETENQLELCRMLQSEGVQVMVENIGHISLDRLEKHCQLLRMFHAPIMPLGPIPTDNAINEDHIASAIGASMMGYMNCAHIINCVTRSEHSKSFFSIEETIEAIRTAKVAAHVIDVAKGINVKIDDSIYYKRASEANCLVDQGEVCTRCGNYCPLKFTRYYG